MVVMGGTPCIDAHGADIVEPLSNGMSFAQTILLTLSRNFINVTPQKVLFEVHAIRQGLDNVYRMGVDAERVSHHDHDGQCIDSFVGHAFENCHE